MSETFGQHLANSLRNTALAYVVGDQVAPCVVLWPDPEKLWARVIPQLQSLMPELFVFGPYAPDQRTGPALWLRCVESRSVATAPASGMTPVFYLPGVSREQLRAMEDCPAELIALLELQFRGVLWLHANGKEWTPFAFVVSKLGGLGLEASRDEATLEALAGALPTLFGESVSRLGGRPLDAKFFNDLVAPDASGQLLRWLNDPKGFRQGRTPEEWRAFCQLCRADFHLDPDQADPLRAAELLAERGNHWNGVWLRFAESPANYPGIPDWLKRAAPKSPTIFDSAEIWPHLNERDEQQLHAALADLAERQADEVAAKLKELDSQHGVRRGYVWQKLGLSPLATALGPLTELAKLTQFSPGAPTAEEFAAAYAKEGWRVDAAALATMAACGTQEQHASVLAAVRSVYLPWLENSTRHLQKLVRDEPHKACPRRSGALEPKPGRVVLFADGLRLDIGWQLAQQLAAGGLTATSDWEWSVIPTVTATAKPAASPLANELKGREAGDAFAPILATSGQLLTPERFVAALRERGWQCLGPDETGNPAGAAWTECGALDKRGHNEGWKLARAVAAEIRDLMSRITALLQAGWSEVTVITDHGWLLVPGGLPKIEIKAFLAEQRWGRCAALKPGVQTEVPTLPWFWNHDVAIATPPGAGCFRAGMEYSHGGVSLQEMVIPRLQVSSHRAPGNPPVLAEVKWTGAKCRLTVTGDLAGVRADIRSWRSDPASSLLADRQPREITAEGKVTVFLENDADVGRAAEIVLLDLSGQVVHSRAIQIGQ